MAAEVSASPAVVRPRAAPNFLIVGAPKCGTTALSEYLRAHPQVFMSQPKEPHYFAEDFPNHRCVESWDAYTGLFESVTSRHRAIGEASVFYMYSATAIPAVLRRIPDARLLVLLRNPIDVAVSMHAQTRYNMEEDIENFEQAWRACDDRRRGERLPQPCRELKTLLYDELPLLGRQLQRLLETAPRQNVKWLFYDDLARNPADVYAQVLEFLGLDDDCKSEFPPVNRRKRHRVRSLAKFTETPPKQLVTLALSIKQVLPIREWGVLGTLRAANRKHIGGRSVESSALRREMRAHFGEDIRLLSQITGRDLSHWA